MAEIAVQDTNSDTTTTPTGPVEQATVAPPAAAVTPVQAPAEKKKMGMPHLSKSAVIIVLLVLAVVALGAYSFKLSSDKSDLKKQLSAVQANPQALVQQQTNDLISKVGKLIDLPAGETPTIAAVTDVAQAKKQSAFFNNAENGDKVLLYVKAGKAILYRPSTNKIIESQPLTINNSTTPTTGTTTTK